MLQQDPFADFPDAPPPRPMQNSTRVIGAAPPAERRAEEDQAMDRQRLANEAARLGIAQASEARQSLQQERDNARREAGFDASESERKAGAFLIRALGANASYEATGEGARSLPQQALAEAFPDFENYFVSGSRQVADSAQDEFIAASLRQDSGAAIPTEELEKQRRIYFPMPGDGPEVLAQKAEARRRAILGLEQSAGRLAEQSRRTFEENFESLLEAQDSEPEREPADTTFFDPTVPAEGSFGDNGQGDSLVLMQGGKLYGLSRGRLADGQPIYVEFGSEDADSVTAESRDLFDRIQGAVQFREERSGKGDFFDVAKSGLSLGLLDEASGVGGAIGEALTGDFNLGDNYSAYRAAEQYRIAQGREGLGAAAIPVELLGAGGAVRSLGSFGTTRQAVQGLRSAGKPVTRANVQRAMTNRATAEGVGIGVVAGAAQGDTLEERGTNAIVGGVAGGALGRLGQGAANALSNRAARAVPPTSVQGAADDLRIDLIPAVTGGTATQRLTGAARQGFISDRPIAKAVGQMEAQGQAARTRASQAAGDAIDAEDAGELVRRGAQVYSERTSKLGGRLYDRADRAAGGQTFPLTGAVRAADDELANLAKAPGGEDSQLFRELTTLRNQMANGEFEVGGIKALRTRLRNEIMQRGLRGSPEDAAYQSILRAATDDMMGGLRRAGNDRAANALATANDFWRTRVQTIDQVLDPLIGKNAPRSGEQILTAIERLAKPDSGKAVNLRRLMQAMPKDEASAVQATVISRLGRPTAGAAEIDRQGFRFETFLTNWNNMSPRAREALFPAESRKALGQLAQVAQGVKRAGGSLNTSNTAGALINQGAVTGALWWLADPLTAVAAAGGQHAVGKLLASPSFARMLAGAPRKATAQQRQAFSNRLGNLAQAEPAIAREIAIYQRALVANDNPASRLAAEDEEINPPN